MIKKLLKSNWVFWPLVVMLVVTWGYFANDPWDVVFLIYGLIAGLIAGYVLD